MTNPSIQAPVYRCHVCAFKGTAEQLAGHYRVVKHQPEARVLS